MRIKQKLYSVRVDCKGTGASLFCLAYGIGSEQRHVGVEYKEFLWSTSRDDLYIPSHRQATFKEELFVMHEAVSTFSGPRDKEQSHIQETLKGAYGDDCQISIKVIEPEPLP